MWLLVSSHAVKKTEFSSLTEPFAYSVKVKDASLLGYQMSLSFSHISAGNRCLQATHLHVNASIWFWELPTCIFLCHWGSRYLGMKGWIDCKVVGNLTSVYSLVNTVYVNVMTLWQSYFLENVRNTCFGIDCPLLIPIKAYGRKILHGSQWGLLGRSLPGWLCIGKGGVMSQCHHIGLSVTIIATFTPWIHPDVCSMILTSTSLDRHLI